MTATLDKIKNFINSPISYVQLKNNDFFREAYHSNSLGEALPLTEHYYHPLNPCFLFELVGPGIMQHAPIITIRDGFLSFMDFLLNNHQSIPHWNTTFLVPKNFEKLIPTHLSPYFIGYDFSQKESPKGREKFIFSYLTEEYLGSDIDLTLNKLDISDNDRVTLFLPQETNLEKISYNNIFAEKFLFKLSLKLRNTDVRHINTHDFLNTTDFSQYELIDLALDQYLVSDNFIHFLMSSRGCRNVFKMCTEKAIYSLDMSMYHQMNLYEITPDNDLFSELLLYKKQRAGKLIEDPYFTSILRSSMNNPTHKA